MRILLTGATGFVGRPLCAALHARGHQLVVLSRHAERTRRTLPLAERCHAWEPQAGSPPPEAYEGVDAMINLAGESVEGRWNPTKKAKIRDSRILGTRNLVSGLNNLEARPEILISTSAIGYYGSRGDESLGEDSTPGGDFLAEVSVAWEAEANAARKLGLRVVCPRVAVVLGQGGGAFDAMKLPFRLGLGGPMGGGKQWWSWIHLSDLVELYIYALEQDLSGPLNAASPHPLRQAEFAKEFGRALHRPAFLPAPALALKMVLGGFAVELLHSRRVLPVATQAAGFHFAFPELRSALEDLCS